MTVLHQANENYSIEEKDNFLSQQQKDEEENERLALNHTTETKSEQLKEKQKQQVLVDENVQLKHEMRILQDKLQELEQKLKEERNSRNHKQNNNNNNISNTSDGFSDDDDFHMHTSEQDDISIISSTSNKINSFFHNILKRSTSRSGLQVISSTDDDEFISQPASQLKHRKRRGSVEDSKHHSLPQQQKQQQDKSFTIDDENHHEHEHSSDYNGSDDDNDDNGHEEDHFFCDVEQQQHQSQSAKSNNDIVDGVGEVGDADDNIYSNSFRHQVKERALWLIGLLILQSGSSFILSANDTLLKNHIELVHFLTMLVGAGGNAGNQASVRVIRDMALGRLNSNQNIRNFLNVELKMALSLSFILTITGIIRAAIFFVPGSETIAIACSLWMIVVTSIFIGALLPFLMKFLRIDPAHSCTTIQVLMDIMGVALTCAVSTVVLETSLGKRITGTFLQSQTSTVEGIGEET